MSTLFPTMRELTPAAMFGSLAGHRHLLGRLIRRNITTQYRTSVGGLAWTVLKPLALLAIYGFVFGTVFKSRITTGEREFDPIDFSLSLFLGLTLFTVFAEMFGKAPVLVAGHANYVKKVVFPLDVLVVGELGAVLFHGLVSLLILLVAMAIVYGGLPLTALLLPVVLIPLIMMTVGIAWLMASLGVFLRDLGQLVPLLTTALIFLSPVFYPVENLPEFVRPFLYLNPLTVPVEEARRMLFLSSAPAWWTIGAYWAASALMMWGGWVWFQKTRKGFSDVL